MQPTPPMLTPAIHELSPRDPTHKLLFLLASSPTRSLPACLFTRPFSITQGDKQSGYATLGSFHNLFKISSNSNREAHQGGAEYAPSTSQCDWHYGAVDLGPELEVLRRRNDIQVTQQEMITFLEVSVELRQKIWTFFAANFDEHLKAHSELCAAILLSLPVPYTEPLWEMTAFALKDIITSTLIPFLLTGTIPPTFQHGLLTERICCVLIFHLTNLGFVFDDLRWNVLFNNLPWSNAKLLLKIYKELSYLLNDPSPEQRMKRQKIPKEFNLPQVPLCVSLVGFTISQMPWRSSRMDMWEVYESWRFWWNDKCPSSLGLLEEIACAILYPESIKVTTLTSWMPHISICALAVGLNRSGYLETSCNLLEFSLAAKTTEKSSRVHGLLFAELVKSLTLLDHAGKACDLGAGYIRETDSDGVYVAIATADAFIALGKYNEAEGLLVKILSTPSLVPYEEICSLLRLNKVWRRHSDVTGHQKFADNLARVVEFIKHEHVQTQEDYMIELQATVYHVREYGEPVPSDLRKVIENTLMIYQEEDATLHELRTRLGALIETSDTTFCSRPAADFNLLAPSRHPSDSIVTSHKSSVSRENHVSFSPPHRSDPHVRATPSTSFSAKRSEEAWQKRNLLSLDGGGTRGYWTLLVLSKLMQQISVEERRQQRLEAFPNATAGADSKSFLEESFLTADDILPCHYFDLICGASTGGLIALLLSRFRMSFQDCRFYYEMTLQSHSLRKRLGPQLYPDLSLGSSLRFKRDAKLMKGTIEYLTKSYLMEDHIRTVPGTCAMFLASPAWFLKKSGLMPGGLCLHRSYDIVQPLKDHPNRFGVHGEASTLNIWQCAQDTMGMSSDIDRDLPREGVKELIALYGEHHVGTVVSMGPACGAVENVVSYENIPKVNVKSMREMGVERYWQFDDEMGIDTEVRMRVLVEFGKWLLQSKNAASLEECAKELVAQRRARALDRDRWELFATGVAPKKSKQEANIQAEAEHTLSMQRDQGGPSS